MPPTHINYWILQQHLGRFNLKAGQYSKTRMLMPPAFDKITKLVEASQPIALYSSCEKARFQLAYGDFEAAKLLCMEVIPMMESKLGPVHAGTLSAKTLMGEVCIKLGQFAEAMLLLDETHSALIIELGSDHPLTLSCLHQIAEAHRQSGNLQNAKELFATCLTYRKAKLGDNHPDTLMTLTRLACAHRDLGDIEIGLEMLDDALEWLDAVAGKEHPLVFDAAYEIGKTYELKGEHIEAKQTMNSCWEGRKRVLGEKHRDTLEVEKVLQSFS
ncbi:hypothetical protein HDU76_012070 [Blyttiomyces sp. JEL0837]|nr:hypothetical protein HDU76_012070 [Blyttiomyces sp. JEL0837]